VEAEHRGPVSTAAIVSIMQLKPVLHYQVTVIISVVFGCHQPMCANL